MAEHLPFSGILALDPGEPLSAEGSAFLGSDRRVIDRLLRLGASGHRHDAHPALAMPPAADPPTVVVDDNGGAIPADTELHVAYTFIDADGGETSSNSDPVVVTTPGGLDDPEDVPVLDADHDAGTLLANNYYYAVSVTDGVGGETALGPSEAITVDPGYASNQITVSGLSDIVTTSGGAGWRLWRMIGGGQWTKIAEGDAATDEVVDDGTLCPDCGPTPLPTGSGDTRRTNLLRVTVPGPGPDAAVSFRIYASEDGTFEAPCLLGQYPVADLDVEKVYAELEFLPEAPPVVPTAMPGANKLDPDTDLLDWHWKRPVADAAALPEPAEEGDTRVTLDDGHLHVYIGGAWGELSGGGGGGPITASQLATQWTGLQEGALPGIGMPRDIAAADPGYVAFTDAGLVWSNGDGYIPDAAVGLDALNFRTYVGAQGEDGWAATDFELLTNNWTTVGAYLAYSGNEVFYLALVDRVANELRIARWANGGGPPTVLATQALPEAPALNGPQNITLKKEGSTLTATFALFGATVSANVEATYNLVEGDMLPVVDWYGMVGQWSAAGAFRLQTFYAARGHRPWQLVASYGGNEITLAEDAEWLAGRFGRSTQQIYEAGVAAAGVRMGALDLGRGWTLYRIATNIPTRVRLYATEDDRDNDDNALVDVSTAGGALTHVESLDGMNLDDPPALASYYTVDNLDVGAGDVTVDLLVLRTE